MTAADYLFYILLHSDVKDIVRLCAIFVVIFCENIFRCWHFEFDCTLKYCR